MLTPLHGRRHRGLKKSFFADERNFLRTAGAFYALRREGPNSDTDPRIYPTAPCNG